MKKCLMEMWDAWCEFWFGAKDLYSLCLFRSVVLFLMFLMYSIRLSNIKLLYFEQGLMPASLAHEFLPDFWQHTFVWYPHSDQFLLIFHCIYVLLLLILALGFFGRKATWLALFFHLMFMQRNMTVIYGADLINTFWLFYLSLTANNKHLNIWQWWRSGRQSTSLKSTTSNDILSSVGMRLIQIQLCVTYVFTGMEKLKGPKWWDGTAIWHVMGNQQVAPVDLSFFQNFPWLIGILTFSVLFFEIYFPLVWIKKMRPYILIFGFGFHVASAFLMSLHFFAFVTAATYIVFVSPATTRAWVHKIQQLAHFSVGK